MNWSDKFKQHKWLWLILFAALILRVWGLSTVGVGSDGALYAYRAVGWLDYLGIGGQSTPLLWFNQIPWWSNLSFHDHPPLVFALIFLSTSLFGQSAVAVLLPGILASLGTAWLIYMPLLQVRSKSTALLAAAIFSLASYSVWVARAGLLEGVELFFITLSLYAFVRFLQTEKNKFLFIWGAAIGLALLSKYTALFLIPAYGLFILWRRPKLLKSISLWLAGGLTIILLTPVIVYNVMMFKTRGHFDASLSSIVGMQPEDFSLISSRSLSFDLIGNLSLLWNTLHGMISLPLLLLFVASIVFVGWRGLFKKSNLNALVFLNVTFLILMFLFAGAGPRFLPIIMPWLSVSLALMLVYIVKNTAPKVLINRLAWALVVAVAVFELLFSVNSNLIANPIGEAGVAYATDRFYNQGFSELDKYFKQVAYPDLPPRKRIRRLNDLGGIDLFGASMVLFDDRANWFSRVWYVQRYQSYYSLPYIYYDDLIKFSQGEGFDVGQLIEQVEAKNFWIVYATPQSNRASLGKPFDEAIENFVALVEAAGNRPVKQIKNYKGDIVFKVYKIK